MDDYGIKVSRAGRDIGTNHVLPGGLQDPDDISFDSAWFAYKILTSGTASLAIPSSLVNAQVNTLTISHDLGYAPVVLMYFSVDSGVSWWLSNADTEGQPSGYPLRVAEAQSTSTTVGAEVLSWGVAAYTLMISYQICAEPSA